MEGELLEERGMVMTTSVNSSLKQKVVHNIEENQDLYLSLSHQIHEKPEIGNEEFFASELLNEYFGKGRI